METYAPIWIATPARWKAPYVALAGYIRDFDAAVKGVAIQEPQSIDENEVRLRVEFVYGDRNDAQNYYLQPSAAGWRIARQENAIGVKAIVPDGTPVE